MNLLSKNTIFYLVLLLNIFSAKSQDTLQNKKSLSNNEIIQFIGEYPMGENKNNESIKTKLGELIFGKKKELIKKPVNVLASNPGHFWILDQGNGILIEKEAETAKIPTQISKADKGFPSLVGLCFIPGNDILFTDSKLNQIFKISSGEKDIKIINDSLNLQQPTGIAYSNVTEEIWVVETAAHRISVLNKNGEFLRHIGERGKSPGNFNFPTYIWIDNFGKVYIVDAMNFRVQIFNSEGEFLLEFGEAGDATGFFASPKGIATDSYGNIYIADALFHSIQIFDKKGQFLYYFGSQGQKNAQFWMPAGLYIDSNNYIYVADSYNSRIQIFKLIIEN
ncbi:MAG: 6-bladed beta-propeller [Bacteroidales bacterium]|nr:6-bladed beta-propeller [Bacteroidales bacterium]MCF8392008.1 6-bladed beta-propeller [Bacteroidales bacterium]